MNCNKQGTQYNGKLTNNKKLCDNTGYTCQHVYHFRWQHRKGNGYRKFFTISGELIKKSKCTFRYFLNLSNELIIIIPWI